MDKIICVGKNYPEHAAELGEDQPDQPVLFLKPPSCLMQLPEPRQKEMPRIRLPLGQVHHELEVVFRIGPPKSKDPFVAFTLGLDLTRRDLQSQLKKAGQPWEISKVFKGSAIVGPWFSWAQWKKYRELEFSLLVNGECRQKGAGTEKLWSSERCLELASGYFPVMEGDLLFTGTPPGVGPLKPGDYLEMRWDEEVVARLEIEPTNH
jgi:2-keto-4-pentenoate hydratase/2-oxohepta-3-ene-1,7-dioic acid hydratase in catechol pathway